MIKPGADGKCFGNYSYAIFWAPAMCGTQFAELYVYCAEPGIIVLFDTG
jgi:hypothetical protein